MIKKNKWEKSFRNINGRMPTEEEYKEAVSEGLVQDEDSKDILDRKKIIIIGCVISGLLVIAIAILLIIFFYPKPTNQQTNFNTSSIDSSSSTSSSSTIQSSSSEVDLSVWENLSLNEKIAILVQAYSEVNPKTNILSAENIAMTANGDKGVNDGYIQWYDEAKDLHKLNVVINKNTISFSYIDGTTGQSEQKSMKIDKALTSYYHTAIAKENTENIASKMVTPAELESSKEKSNMSKDGGKFMNGHFVVSYQEMSDFFYNTENTSLEKTPQQLADFWNIHHDESKQINSPVDLRVNMDYAIWSKDYVSKPLTLTAKQLVHIYGTSLNSKAIQADMSEANIQSAVDSWNKNHPSYNAVAFVEGSNGEYTSFPDITDYNDPKFYTHTKSGETVSKEQAMNMVRSGWGAQAMGVPEASAGPEH